MKIQKNHFTQSSRSLASVFAFFIVFQITTPAIAQELDDAFWQTDGKVLAIEHDEVNEIIYIGGEFNYVGPPESFGSSISTSNGEVDFNFANPNREVFASVPDGNGGWYIGGSFTKVGGETRRRLAQIDASGQVTSWNPDVNDPVKTILLRNGILYVGGTFTEINNEDRSRLASFTTSDGVLTDWNPAVDGTVESIVEENGIIYIGGNFQIVGASAPFGSPVDHTTGIVNINFANPNGPVYSSVADGNGGWYIGGSFTEVGGEPRTRLAHLDATGQVTSWNPETNGTVRTMLLRNGILCGWPLH
jgi:hypothetical protein